MQAILGVSVSIIFLLSYFPQIKALIAHKQIEGVSKIFWLSIALATAITASTLIEESAVWYVIVPQCINAAIAFLILLIVAYKKHSFYGIWVYLMMFSFAASILVYWVPNDIVQHWSSFLIAFAYLEQIIHLIYKKTAQGVNYLLYIGFAAGLGIMIINMSVTHAPLSAIITESVNLVMMGIATLITIILNKKLN